MTLSALSGRVDTLETQMAFVNQDLLQRPDLSAFNGFQNVCNQQITTIENTLNTLEAQLNTLQSLYVNLNITVSDNKALFTGHTGATTGDGVHGH